MHPRASVVLRGSNVVDYNRPGCVCSKVHHFIHRILGHNILREELNPSRKQSDIRIPALKLGEGLMDHRRDGVCG